MDPPQLRVGAGGDYARRQYDKLSYFVLNLDRAATYQKPKAGCPLLYIPWLANKHNEQNVGIWLDESVFSQEAVTILLKAYRMRKVTLHTAAISNHIPCLPRSSTEP